MTDTTATKDKLLEAALYNAPFDGWSRKTLALAADETGVDPAEARTLFPAAGDDLLRHLDEWADRQMLKGLAGLDLDAMRVRERIEAGLWLRLHALAPHREAVRRAVPTRIWPGNALYASQATWRTADRLWDAAGDDATGPSRYSKRALVAGVYVATFLYWLEDRSEDQEDTRGFLQRRIAEVMRVGSAPGRLLGGFGRFNPLRRPG
ncbi:COQ9 family protein [Marinivivus vitaminiproducens]|uniref:COQ9 family protein n=1 Tax=Marinivivus vitaminiproducens TaxID=3035935 RepID=UPI0027A92E53|nr:COQ9 family protein [Geminicoccaceae bacterium SCSIO 64248]